MTRIAGLPALLSQTVDVGILERETAVRDAVWGVPLIVLLVGTGVYLTLLLRGLQFRKLGHALYLAFFKRSEAGAEGGAAAVVVEEDNLPGLFEVYERIASDITLALQHALDRRPCGSASFSERSAIAVEYRVPLGTIVRRQ